MTKRAEQYAKLVLVAAGDHLGRGPSVVPIGMPGMEKLFSRYPLLYSRIRFAHEYRPLAQEELRCVLDRRCPA